MRVLHINSNYLYTTLHENLIDHLEKYNIKNKIFMPIHGKYPFAITPKENVYHPICFKKNDRYFFFYKQKKIFNALLYKIDPNCFDLIHAHTLFTDGNVAFNIYKKYNKPFIVAVRDTDLNVFFKKRPYLRKLGVKILVHAEKVVFLSKPYLEKTLRYIPKNMKERILRKSIIIPNGIDSFWIKNRASTHLKRNDIKNKLRIIYVGRISKRKNITTTVKACKILRNKGYNVEFTIVGRIENQREFKKIQRYNFINYLGTQPKEKLIELFRLHDVFVMPSKTETFGLVYAEAISQGLPVIYTKGQGFDQQFEEGQVGFHVKYNDPYQIANRILDIIDNYEEISKNCIILCKKFDWTIIVKEYLNIYNEVVRNEKN